MILLISSVNFKRPQDLINYTYENYAKQDISCWAMLTFKANLYFSKPFSSQLQSIVVQIAKLICLNRDKTLIDKEYFSSKSLNIFFLQFSIFENTNIEIEIFKREVVSFYVSQY